MNLLSSEMEVKLVENLISQCSEKLFTILEDHYLKSPYVKHTDLMQELGVSSHYLKKLEARGLKRVKLDSSDKTIFYKRSDVYQLMDELAE